ncbi:MAG: hypothetical protein ABIP50_01445 [Candidatus Saccharimonadales bacterium]
MKKDGMKATSIRSLLTFVIVILILAMAGGFYLGLGKVRTTALDVSHTAADANASGKQIDELQKLKLVLTQSQGLVDKANALFSTPASYQSQALKDVQKYASQSGVTISNTNFDLKEDTKDTPTVTNTSKPFSITLKSPVSYTKLLSFLDDIEGNLPKMQVTSIDLSRPTTTGSDNVITGDIKIVVSTR